MDIHMHSDSRIHRMLNGCYQPNDDLQFLSTEEKECLLFFENTIDSLQEDFDDDSTGCFSKRTPASENLQAPFDSSLSPVHATNVSSSMMEHDIIDLVHSTSSYTMPDFQNLAVSPESHFEIKPKRDSVASNNSITTSSSDASEENSHQPPPGSIPTPVVIASKIAEHQGSGILSPSTLLEHRRSIESKRDLAVARPNRLPSNISMTRGAKDTSPYSIASAAVNLQERRSQMLANLPAGAHPLEGGEPACIRNLPIRSMSFKDPTPDQSRIEALAKLGLTGGSTGNWNTSSVSKVSSSTSTSNANNATKVNSSAKSANSSPNKVISNANLSNTVVSGSVPMTSSPVFTHLSATHLNPSNSEPKPRRELSSSNINNFGGTTGIITPSTRDAVPPAVQKRNYSIKPTIAEVTHTNFNSYGGKSLVLNRSTSLKAELRDVNLPFADVPDGLNSMHSYLPTSSTSPNNHQNDPSRFKVDPLELKNLNAKLLSPKQAGPVNHPLPASSKSSTLPSTATRPQTVNRSVRSRPDPVPPEILSKPAPPLRSQSVTVQFSGKGVTNEARQDALRRLGLLKKTSK